MSDQSPTGLEQFDTGVDLGGLMGVLSQHLYSTPDVALRELVQNAHDSVVRRRILAERGMEAATPDAFISVVTDAEAGRLDIRDNGSGLTRNEIHQLLATVGRGATGDLRMASSNDDLIGLFGLGFLSAFVVADEVVVTTTSVQTPNETWQYRSSDGHRYTVLPAEPGPIGTVVRLDLKPGFADLAMPRMATSILERYCRLLHVPISIDHGSPINLDPPWRRAESTSRERLAFAADYDSRFEPLVALPVGGPDTELRGQLWVHDSSTYGNADNRKVSVFVRGMLLAENDQDLLPRWAGFVTGTIESPALTPTASRETLQRDAGYTEAQMVMSEALITGLADTARQNLPAWRRILSRHSQALLGASVADERLFDLVADDVLLPSSQGDRTAGALRHGRRMHVSLGADRGFEELLFLARGIPIIRGDLYGVMAFLSKYCERHDLELVTIGTDDGNAALFEHVDIDGSDLAWLNDELAGDDQAVYPARFDPETVPIVVVPDREAELKRRIESDQIDAAAGAGAAALARIHTSGIEDRASIRVYVNMACPTIERMLGLRSTNLGGATQAAMLLNTLKTLMAATDRGSGSQAKLTDAFADALAVIDSLLIREDRQ